MKDTKPLLMRGNMSKFGADSQIFKNGNRFSIFQISIQNYRFLVLFLVKDEKIAVPDKEYQVF